MRPERDRERVRDRHVPKDCFGALGELRERYRCPEPLAAFADHYRTREPSSVPPPARLSSAPPPAPIVPIDELRIVKLPSATALEEYVAREIQKALSEGLQPHDIAVLSLGGQLKTDLCARDRIGQTPVRRADAPDAGEQMRSWPRRRADPTYVPPRFPYIAAS